MKYISLVGLALTSALLLSPQKTLAHSVQTDYLLSGDNGLALDATFSTGEPLADAPVKIYSPDNLSEPWMEGKTDENGQFNFLPDQAMEGEWTVQIGEYGHSDILSVPVEKEGIQIDEISQGQTEAIFAQSPFTVKTLPAQAVSGTQERPVGFDYAEWMLLGMAVMGGTVAARRMFKS